MIFLIKNSGAAMLAPMINPYEARMTKDETRRTWEKWSSRRRFMYFVARRYPKFLSYFYRKSFFSGKHDRIDTQLSFSLGKKVRIKIVKISKIPSNIYISPDITSNNTSKLKSLIA